MPIPARRPNTSIASLLRTFALLSLPLAACGDDADAGASLDVQITGLRTDALRIDFKIYRADCAGTHPCATWLSQTAVPQQKMDTLSYRLTLPPEVMDLSVYLRIETTQLVQLSRNCIGARATAIQAQRGSEYAGKSLSVALNRDSVGPPFKVSMPNVCPFRYMAQGTGSGTVLLKPAGFPDLTDSSTFPDEFLRGTTISATAMPGGSSKFVRWGDSSPCAGKADLTCSFTMDDRVTLVPVFGP